MGRRCDTFLGVGAALLEAHADEGHAITSATSSAPSSAM